MDPIDERLRTGFNRFRFGFAEPGEQMTLAGKTVVFVGDYARKKDAVEIAKSGGHVHPYLSGHRKVGWAVWRVEQAPAEAAVELSKECSP